MRAFFSGVVSSGKELQPVMNYSEEVAIYIPSLVQSVEISQGRREFLRVSNALPSKRENLAIDHRPRLSR